jgi:uncharacterized protein YkwD
MVVVLMGLGACSGQGSQRNGALPSFQPPTQRTTPPPAVAGPIRLAPVSDPVARYNEPQPLVSHTSLGDAMAAALGDAAARAGLPVPLPDSRLFQACADLAEIVPEEQGISGATLDNTVVEFVLQRNGIIEPAVRLLFGWGDIGVPARFVKELQPKLAEVLRDGAMVRFGVGVARRRPDGTGAVVFALQGSGVSTLPIRRAAAPDGDVVVDAVIERRFHDPEVFVTYEGGDTRQVELKPGRPGGFIAQIACGAHEGRHQIEIIASDASGATVLANFPVWCAAEPPLALTVGAAPDDAPVDGAAQAEQRLLASVNRDRAAAGLPVLLWDDAVAAVARSYSEEMRTTRVVAHISSTTGSAADRVRAAGIDTRIVLENVARAYGLNEAHQALMNSPGHRANLMSAAATHVGMGVAFGDDSSGRRELYITQVFTRVRPTTGRVRRELIRGRVGTVR